MRLIHASFALFIALTALAGTAAFAADARSYSGGHFSLDVGGHDVGFVKSTEEPSSAPEQVQQTLPPGQQKAVRASGGARPVHSQIIGGARVNGGAPVNPQTAEPPGPPQNKGLGARSAPGITSPENRPAFTYENLALQEQADRDHAVAKKTKKKRDTVKNSISNVR